MKPLTMALALVWSLTALAPRATAQPSLQDLAVSVNGTVSDYNNLGDTDPTQLGNMDSSAYSSYTTGDTLGTGLGRLTYTYNPGVSATDQVNFYFDLEGAVPFFNEYGIVNGSAPAGMSYEIAKVNPSVGGIQFYNGVSESFANPNDVNEVPVGNTNFLNNCAVTPCNADVATGLGFNFFLPVGDEAIITVNVSTTNPGGFNLEQVHPVDPASAAETDIYFNGSISIVPAGGGPPPGVPEPTSWLLMGSITAIFFVCCARRKADAGQI